MKKLLIATALLLFVCNGVQAETIQANRFMVEIASCNQKAQAGDTLADVLYCQAKVAHNPNTWRAGWSEVVTINTTSKDLLGKEPIRVSPYEESMLTPYMAQTIQKTYARIYNQALANGADKTKLTEEAAKKLRESIK